MPDERFYNLTGLMFASIGLFGSYHMSESDIKDFFMVFNATALMLWLVVLAKDLTENGA